MESCLIAGCRNPVQFRVTCQAVRLGHDVIQHFCSVEHAPNFLYDLRAMLAKPHFKRLSYEMTPQRIGLAGESWQATIERM